MANGDIWIEMGVPLNNNEEKPGPELTGNHKFYLTSNNNVAMIQTGHSNCQSTNDERKIIANTLFYLKQRSDKKKSIDNEGYDITPPSNPTLVSIVTHSTSLTVKVESFDYGTSYSYKVLGYGHDAENTEPIAESSIVSVLTDPSGIQCYKYCVSSESSLSKEDLINTSTDGTMKIQNEWGKVYYLHIYAVDNNDKESEISVIPLPVSTNLFTPNSLYRLHQNLGLSLNLMSFIYLFIFD